jgi:hypothetical protein
VGDAGLTTGSEEKEFAMVVREELGLNLVEVVGVVTGCFVEIVSTDGFWPQWVGPRVWYQ